MWLDVAPSVPERRLDAWERRRDPASAARRSDRGCVGNAVRWWSSLPRGTARRQRWPRRSVWRAGTSPGCRARRATAIPAGCWSTWSVRFGGRCRARRTCSVSGSTSPPCRVDPGLAVQALESELERLLVEPLVVVIDDAEHLAGAAEAEQVVADLARDAAARRLRVAVLGRRPLVLRTARLQRRRPAHGAGPGRPRVRRGGMRRADAAPARGVSRHATSWRRSGRRPRDGRSGSRSRPARSGRWRSGRRAPVRSTRTWRRSCWTRWSRACATR